MYKGKKAFELKPRIFRGWISTFRAKFPVEIKNFFTLYSGTRARFEGRALAAFRWHFIFTKGTRVRVVDRLSVLNKRLLGILRIGELRKIFTQGLPSFRVKFFTYIKEVRPTLLKAKTIFSLKVKAYFYLSQCKGIIFRQKVVQKLAFMGNLCSAVFVFYTNYKTGLWQIPIYFNYGIATLLTIILTIMKVKYDKDK